MSFLCALCYSLSIFAVLSDSAISLYMACAAWLIYSILYYFMSIK
jgi:hypothetical protein